MSIVSSLFLLLLCLSLLACNARHLPHALNYKEAQIKSQVFNKDDKKGSLGKISVPEKLKLVAPNGDDYDEAVEGKDEGIHNNVTEKAKDSKGKRRIMKSRSRGKKNSVSWQVPLPRRKHRQPEAFNLDYSPPKTHPPHHN